MNKDNLKIVTVVVPNIKGKAIIQSDSDLYIVQAKGYWTNQETQVDLNGAIKVISLLYGIDMLLDNKFEDVVEFIKGNW